MTMTTRSHHRCSKRERTDETEQLATNKKIKTADVHPLAPKPTPSAQTTTVASPPTGVTTKRKLSEIYRPDEDCSVVMESALKKPKTENDGIQVFVNQEDDCPETELSQNHPDRAHPPSPPAVVEDTAVASDTADGATAMPVEIAVPSDESTSLASSSISMPIESIGRNKSIYHHRLHQLDRTYTYGRIPVALRGQLRCSQNAPKKT